MIRRTCGALALLAVWLTAAGANAQALTLSWSAPSSCPSGAYVEQRVTTLLGAQTGAALRVLGRVRKSRGRFVLELSFQGERYRAQRRLEAARCQSLADASAWLIALALDPSLAARHDREAAARDESARAGARDEASTTTAGEQELQPHEAVVAGDAPTDQSAERAAEPATREAARSEDEARTARGEVEREARASSAPVRRLSFRTRLRDRPRWWRMGAFVGLWQASLPSAQASLGARGGYGMGLLLLELRGAAHLARTQPVREGVRARYASQELSSALCAQWGQRLRGGPCAALALLRSTGSVRGTTNPRRDALLWGSGGVTIQLGYNAAHWLELLAEVGVMLPMTPRPRFTVGGLGELAQAAPLSVYARVGFGFRATESARSSAR